MNIVIVDDDEVTRAGIASILTGAGETIMAAIDHVGAIDDTSINWGEVDVLICDLRATGEFDAYLGIGVMQQARERARSIDATHALRLVGISAFATDPGLQLRAWETGIDALYSRTDLTSHRSVVKMVRDPRPDDVPKKPVFSDIDPDLQTHPNAADMVRAVKNDPKLRDIVLGRISPRNAYGRSEVITQRRRFAETAKLVPKRAARRRTGLGRQTDAPDREDKAVPRWDVLVRVARKLLGRSVRRDQAEINE